MAQILKEDVKQRIYEAAVEEFYRNDYRTATIRNIALKANIPSGLVYSYYQNKEDLFEAIVEPFVIKIDQLLKMEESKEGENHGDPFTNFKQTELAFILNLMDSYKQLIILIDKSNGTKYQGFKDEIIHRLQLHIKSVFREKQIQHLDDLLIHIWASSLIEGICEIIRHYKDREWAAQMLNLIAEQYCYGINAFLH